MKRLVLSILLFFIIYTVSAQNINTKSVALENGKVVLVYTISQLNNKKISTALYTSLDNFSNPVKEVSGNIGENIKEGENTVYWDYQKENGALPEEIDFAIKSKEISPKYASLFTHNNNFFWINNEFSKKEENLINWRTNDSIQEVLIELYKDNNKLMIIDFVKNKSQYLWTPTIDNGENYQIKILNKANPEDYIISNPFEIIKKEAEKTKIDLEHAFYIQPKLFLNQKNAIDWTHALFAESYKVSLYHNNIFDRLLSIEKTSKTSWTIPETIERDDNYQIKVEDSDNPSNYIISNFFEIDKPGKKKEIKKEQENKKEIQVNEEYKKGLQIPIIFENELNCKNIIVQLWQEDKLIRTIETTENKGFYNWKIPEDQEKGKNYRVKIIDSENPENLIQTTEFKISK